MGRTTNTLLVGAGAAMGAIAATVMLKQIASTKERKSKCEHCLQEATDRRSRLPGLIILVRHGESGGNADHTLWEKMPDSLIELSSNGVDESGRAGERVESIFKQYDNDPNLPSIRRVHLIVSPFERTLQTAFFMRPHFNRRIVRTEVEPRIREQEFGNVQGEEFQNFRGEQKCVGRFWYRFPTGESGADVYDRVKSWWFESILNINSRVGYEPVDALVVVTHGLTMRFVLMQLFHWSPNTFHSVWNASNCDLYVLTKDLQKPGMSPYVMDDKFGETPQSSVDVVVSFVNGKSQILKLTNYLSIPPPRTTRYETMKEMLAEQYPSIDMDGIVGITLSTGNCGPVRSTIDRMAASGRSSIAEHYNVFERAERERSCRFPNLNPANSEQ